MSAPQDGTGEIRSTDAKPATPFDVVLLRYKTLARAGRLALLEEVVMSEQDGILGRELVPAGSKARTTVADRLTDLFNAGLVTRKKSTVQRAQSKHPGSRADLAYVYTATPAGAAACQLTRVWVVNLSPRFSLKPLQWEEGDQMKTGLFFTGGRPDG